MSVEADKIEAGFQAALEVARQLDWKAFDKRYVENHPIQEIDFEKLRDKGIKVPKQGET